MESSGVGDAAFAGVVVHCASLHGDGVLCCADGVDGLNIHCKAVGA